MQDIIIGAITKVHNDRVAQIAKGIDLVPENTVDVYDLIKGANPDQKRKVKKVMDEWKAGALHSGSKKGAKVTDYKQAIAIALSESGLHKGLCRHGVQMKKCEKCNKDDIEKDMEMGSGDADGDGVTASVEKAAQDLLEKGGEGSRGGKVIGHTESGKPIYENYEANHVHYKDFTSTDHGNASYRHANKSYNAKSDEKKEFHKKISNQHRRLEFEKDKKGKTAHKKTLEKYHEEDPEKFFEVVGKHYEPEDDGESEHTMFENLNKHPKLEKIVSQLHKKFKKGEDGNDFDKAVENLFGVQDPVQKAFSDVLNKGGKGSNKAGRKIGATRSGKNVHVFKEATDYGDFEPVDHLEAHKIHLHHAGKVTGVAAVNSRIRAHDHEDLARIKAAKKEQEELEASNAQAQKKADGGKQTKKPEPKGKNKPATRSKTATVKKALDDYLNKDTINKAFTDLLEKGEISSSFSAYSDKQPLIFSKSGKEISAKLLAQAATITSQEATLEAQMATLEEQIGVAPDSENCSYSVKTIKVPNYSYDIRYPAEVERTAVYSVTPKVDSVAKSTTQLCNKYNDLVYKLINAKEDLHAIRLITENIESTKKYPLSVGQLTSLGF